MIVFATKPVKICYARGDRVLEPCEDDNGEEIANEMLN